MEIFESLKEISTDYSIFEKDQLLTHSQLNSIADFFDDQSRLSRICLLGVGIACGLKVTVNGVIVKVSKGVGVTTDGDLLNFAVDREFDRFKPYDESAPKYAPFFVEGKMLTLHELVEKNIIDDRATSLNRFNEQTGSALSDMAAVLLMESYVTDRDICSGTDCDNLGQNCRHTIRLLLVDKQSAGALNQEIMTPDGVYSALHEILVTRPHFDPTVTTVEGLANAFKTACNAIEDQLLSEFAGFYGQCSPFLGGVFDSDPTEGWKKSLEGLKASFSTMESGIQYYYDFLKDVAETYNDFREKLFGDSTWCCPDSAAFPKHLLLGSLATGAGSEENRTGFYPSPAVSCTKGHLDHAKFLAQKIDILIQSFDVPDSTGTTTVLPGRIETTTAAHTIPLPPRPAVRITPSATEEHTLEERAIPYYYQVNGTNPIQKFWNYRLHQQGMDGCNHSYNASSVPRPGEYRAQGSAANPLGSHLGRFGFFRVEGHLGRDVTDTLEYLEGQIKNSNLPVALRSVLAGTDKGKTVKRPGIRYTDLHRFHYMLRQDVSSQLKETLQFGQEFKQKVDSAVDGKIVTDSPDDPTAVAIKATARDQFNMVSDNLSGTPEKLNLKYSAYKADDSWKSKMPLAIQAAGQFKYNLSDVVKTEFMTPFDTLIGTTHIRWLDWLDDIIRRKEDIEDDKLLLSPFISQNPGMEHSGGVTKGGTLVLVYNEASRVVGDFMLPYYCSDTSEEEPEEPPLTIAPIKPGWILGNGITVLPPRTKFVKGKLNEFKEQNLGDMVRTSNLNALVQDKLASFKFDEVEKIQTTIQGQFASQQKDYLDALKDSVTTMSNVLAGKRDILAEGAAFADKGLDKMVANARAKETVVEYLREKAAQPDLPEEKRTAYQEQAKAAEIELADAIGATTQYVAENVDAAKMDISIGSEGMAALVEMNKGMETIKTPEAQTRVNNTIELIQGKTGDAGLTMILGRMSTKRVG